MDQQNPPHHRWLHLTAEWNKTGILISLSSGSAVEETLSNQTNLSLDSLQKAACELSALLTRVNLHGDRNDSPQPDKTLESLGRYWFDQLFSQGLKQRLKESVVETLILHLNPLLTFFPWELLHDGQEFLGCRYSVGRIVPDWQNPADRSVPAEPLDCLVLSNPANNLEEASKEGDLLSRLLENDPRLQVEWLNSRITSDQLKERLPRASILHYSGHSTSPSQDQWGWLLADGVYDTRVMNQVFEKESAPIFVMNNGCHTAERGVKPTTGSPGFAEVFLRNGCRHYIGALNEVIDEGSRCFALSLYRQVLAGIPVGLAVKQARLEVRTTRGPHDLTWAQYVLYGDPLSGLYGPDVTETIVCTLCIVEPCDGNGTHAQRFDRYIRETLAAFPHAEKLKSEENGCLLIFSRPSEAVRFALLFSARSRISDPLGDSPPPCRLAIHEGEMTLHRNRSGGIIRRISGQPFQLIQLLPGIALPNQILMTKPVFDDARALLKENEIGEDIHTTWLDHGPYRFQNWEEPVGICEVGEQDWAPLKAPPDSSVAWRHISPDQEPVLGWRPAIGQEIPTSRGWILEEKLGEGGFGEVWKACNLATGECRVYKFCFRADRVRSLKREASLFQYLRQNGGDHPNIIRLYEFFFDEPPYFISMEYVPGKDLAAWLSSIGGTNLPLEIRLDIVARVADVLQFAHDAGIIHRDIKPSNILIAGDPQNYQVKLGDFGIGQVQNVRSLLSPAFGGFTETFAPTEMASHSGTRLYMAPELLVGKSTSIRSDIYSLGVILYQLIVDDLHRPVTADWRMDIQDPLLREDLEHCLAGDPSTRFPSASDLSRSLRGLHFRREKQAAAEQSRLRDLTRKRILTAASFAFILVSLLAGSLGYGLLREHHARQETEVARQNAEEELYVSSIKLAEQAIEDYRFKQAYDLLMKAPEAFRNWEWGYLLFLCNQDLMTFRGHTGEVRAVTYSPQGSWLATGGEDGTIRIWDPQTGAELHCLTGNHESVNTLAVSPNGKRLAAGCYGHVVELWNTVTWQISHVLEGFDDEITSLSFSGDGSRLAVGCRDSKTRIFEVDTSTILITLSQEKDPVYHIALTPDGRYLATVGGRDDPCDCSARVWDLENGNLIQRMPGTREIHAVAFSPDGRWMATGGQEEVVHIWDWREGHLLQTLTGFTRMIQSICFSHDGRKLAACSREGLIRLWSTETWHEEQIVVGHTGILHDLAFSPDDTLLASVGEDTTCRIWGVDTLSRESLVTHHVDGVLVAELSPDGKTLASCGSHDLIIQLRDPFTGTIKKELDGCTNYIQCGCFSPNGHWFAASGDDRVVSIWDAASGKQEVSLSGPLSRVNTLRFSKDSQWLACGENDGHVHLWNTSDWRHSCWGVVEEEINTLDWHPDGKRLAVGQHSPKVSLWDPFSRTLLSQLCGHTGNIRCVKFSPDGQNLATGSEDFSAILWDSQTGKRLVDYHGHGVFVLDEAFTPEGKRLFTASEDSTVKVWETKSGRDLITLRGHTGPIKRLSYSPALRVLLSGSMDGTVRLWPAFPWHESEYPGTQQEGFTDRLETYKRDFWRKRYSRAQQPALETEPPVSVGLPDPRLEQAIREQLNKPAGTLTRSELSRIHQLSFIEGRIDLDGLEACTNLNTLILTATEVVHATRIGKLHSLRTLSVFLPFIKDFDILRNLVHLKSLRLIRFDGVDLSKIGTLQSLTHLDLIDCQLTRIDALSNLTNLEYLDVNDNGIRDLTPLQGLSNLRWLIAHHNAIESVTPLAGLTRLISLDLSYNPIHDCTPLAGLKGLANLNLRGCDVENVTPLTALRNLRYLDLSINRISSAELVTDMTALCSLDLGRNLIEDIHPLRNLENLRSLSLSGCAVDNASPLARLKTLRFLSLSSTQIDNITPLRGLTGLRYLNLRKTEVKDMSPLLESSFARGMELDIRETPASREVKDQITHLKNKGVVLITGQ